MNAMSPATDVDPCDLETLIGEARDYTRIVEIVAEHLLESADHRDGEPVHPLRGVDEQALIFSIMNAAQAGEKLYRLFHQIEESVS